MVLYIGGWDWFGWNLRMGGVIQHLIIIIMIISIHIYSYVWSLMFTNPHALEISLNFLDRDQPAHSWHTRTWSETRPAAA